MSGEAIRASDGGVTLTVRVTPRARRNQVAGLDHDAIKIKLTAPPVAGAANAALIELVAEWLGVRQSAVSIAGGGKSRHKLVYIRGLSAEVVYEKLGQA
jgi:uncharacterized protein